MDCITDLDDNQSRLLEALQLSLPEEAAGKRKKRHDKKLSLNPYLQTGAPGRGSLLPAPGKTRYT